MENNGWGGIGVAHGSIGAEEGAVDTSEVAHDVLVQTAVLRMTIRK